MSSFDKDIIADIGMIGSSPSVSDGIMHIDVNGTFFNDMKETQEPPFEPMDFSDLKTDDKELYTVISSYSIYSIINAGLSDLFDEDKKEQVETLTALVEEVLETFANSTDVRVDVTLQDVVDFVNKDLKLDVQIPDNYLGIQLSRVWFEVHTGYIALGLKPTPEDWEAIGAFLSSTKQYLLAAQAMEAPASEAFVQF